MYPKRKSDLFYGRIGQGRFRVVGSRGLESLLVQNIDTDSGALKPDYPKYGPPSFLRIPIFVMEDLVAKGMGSFILIQKKLWQNLKSSSTRKMFLATLLHHGMESNTSFGQSSSNCLKFFLKSVASLPARSL